MSFLIYTKNFLYYKTLKKSNIFFFIVGKKYLAQRSCSQQNNRCGGEQGLHVNQCHKKK